MEKPKVISINISQGGIPKLPVDSIRILTDGLQGDEHNFEGHRTPLQAVCLQDIEKLAELYKEGFEVYPGTIGENLTVQHLDVNAMRAGTILTFSGGVILELTKIRQPCRVLDAIDHRLIKAIVGRCGVYAKVFKEGKLQVGETIEVLVPPAFS